LPPWERKQVEGSEKRFTEAASLSRVAEVEPTSNVAWLAEHQRHRSLHGGREAAELAIAKPVHRSSEPDLGCLSAGTLRPEPRSVESANCRSGAVLHVNALSPRLQCANMDQDEHPDAALGRARDVLDRAETLGTEGSAILDYTPSSAAPSNELTLSLGEVCLVNPPKPDTAELPDDTLVSFVPMAAIDADRGAITQPETRTAGQLRKRYRAFRDGDVLLARITPSMENGKVAVVRRPENGFGFATTDVFVLRPVSVLLAEWLWVLLRRKGFREHAAAHMTGKAGQQRVPPAFLRSTPIYVPPTNVQSRMVAEVENANRRLHDAADLAHAALKRIEEGRGAALEAGCTGALTEHDLADGSVADLAARIAEERRHAAKPRPRRHARYTDPQAPESHAADLPELPEDWLWSSVGFAATRMQYGTSARSDADEASGVPYIGMRNIQRGRIDTTTLRYVTLHDDELAAFRLRRGDLLFNRTNSPELVGKAAVFDLDLDDAVFASYLVRVALDPRLVVAEFVNAWISSPWGRAWAQRVKRDAVGQSNINATKLAEMPLPLPPLEVQRRIVMAIGERLGRADDLERRAQTLLVDLRAVADDVLERAVAGAMAVETDADLSVTGDVGQRAARELDALRRKPAARRRSPARPVARGPDVVVEAIEKLPRSFSFTELAEQVPLDGDELVDAVFALLEGLDARLEQRFDRRAGEMRLRRRSA
jgi:type I restriction enzyme, S subunit